MYLQIQSKSFISEVDKSLETCYNFREPRFEYQMPHKYPSVPLQME